MRAGRMFNNNPGFRVNSARARRAEAAIDVTRASTCAAYVNGSAAFRAAVRARAAVEGAKAVEARADLRRRRGLADHPAVLPVIDDLGAARPAARQDGSPDASASRCTLPNGS